MRDVGWGGQVVKTYGDAGDAREVYIAVLVPVTPFFSVSHHPTLAFTFALTYLNITSPLGISLSLLHFCFL